MELAIEIAATVAAAPVIATTIINILQRVVFIFHSSITCYVKCFPRFIWFLMLQLKFFFQRRCFAVGNILRQWQPVDAAARLFVACWCERLHTHIHTTTFSSVQALHCALLGFTACNLCRAVVISFRSYWTLRFRKKGASNYAGRHNSIFYLLFLFIFSYYFYFSHFLIVMCV